MPQTSHECKVFKNPEVFFAELLRNILKLSHLKNWVYKTGGPFRATKKLHPLRMVTPGPVKPPFSTARPLAKIENPDRFTVSPRLFPKNHGISKLVAWRSQNPAIQIQTPPNGVQGFLGLNQIQSYLMFRYVSGWWLNQPIWKICPSKWVHLPQIGLKINNIWVATT